MRWLFIVLAMFGLMAIMNKFAPVVWSDGFNVLGHFIAYGYVIAAGVLLIAIRGLKVAS